MRSPLAVTIRAGVTALVVVALTGAAAVVAAPAWAHSRIIDSTPESGETLTALPAEFSVTANETLLDLGDQGVFALQIRDAAGRYYGDGCVQVVDATMSAAAAIGASGEYTMLWQVISADGHPVSGEIPFTWDAPDGFVAAPGSAKAPSCGDDPAAQADDGSPSPAAVDASSVALWIGIGIAGLGVLVAIIIAIAGVLRARARTGPPKAAPAADDEKR